MAGQMRILAPIAAHSGLALLTALIAYYGFASVLQAACSSRWGTALVVIARAVALAGAGIGWWFCYADSARTLHFCRPAVYPRSDQRAVSVRRRRRRSSSAHGYWPNSASRRVWRSPAFSSIFSSRSYACLIFVWPGSVLSLDLAGTHRLSDDDLRHAGHCRAGRQRVFSRFEFRRFRTVVRRLLHSAKGIDWAVFNHVVDLGDRLQQIWRNHRGFRHRSSFISRGFFSAPPKSGSRSPSWAIR